jgi:hypothetical protein
MGIESHVEEVPGEGFIPTVTIQTDYHSGPFKTKQEAERWVEMMAAALEGEEA